MRARYEAALAAVCAREGLVPPARFEEPEDDAVSLVDDAVSLVSGPGELSDLTDDEDEPGAALVRTFSQGTLAVATECGFEFAEREGVLAW